MVLVVVVVVVLVDVVLAPEGAPETPPVASLGLGPALVGAELVDGFLSDFGGFFVFFGRVPGFFLLGSFFLFLSVVRCPVWLSVM